MHCIEVGCRDFKLAADLSSLSFVTSNIGTEDVAVGNESINVICGNLRIINLMMSGRRRDRIGEMITLGSEALEYRWGFLAGLDVFRIELEKVKHRKAFSNGRALKHAGKGWETSKTGIWEAA